MQNKKVIILIILGIVAIFSLFYGITASPKGRKNLPDRTQVIQRDEKVQLEKTVIPTKRRAKRTKFSSWERNLFSEKGTFVSSSGLTGIIWDEKFPQALIGDAVVGIGDKVGSNTVVKIEKDRVILNDGTKDFELGMGEEK